MAAVAMYETSPAATAASASAALHRNYHQYARQTQQQSQVPSAPSSASSMASLHSSIHSNVDVKLDVQAGALSVDATGSFAVLAGRKGLHLVDLESPYEPSATLYHQTKWDVAVVRCNPHAAFKSYVASTSNHNTLIWDITSASVQSSRIVANYTPSQPLVTTLRGHSRPVNDVSWSPTAPTLLATCSADTKTHLWDMRTPQKPVQTLHAFTTSAVQVEWHRVDATTLATAHEGEVRIWDTRASDKTPAVLITAHMQKIYGIDWHPKRMDELLTCSEDKTVRFWNVSQPRICQGSLTTSAPVWRARYTPFGDGVVTSCQRQDNALRLWRLLYSPSVDASAGGAITPDPVHAFAGHSDVVKSFVWRERASNGGNQYQLVSWAKNQELRLWRIDSQQLELCGFTPSGISMNEASGASGESAEGSESLEQLEAFQLANQRQASRQDAMAKYDVSVLKNDLAPLVVPPTAVPLGASEYSLLKGQDEDDTAALRAMLTFDDDFSKLGEAHVSDDEDDEEDENRESLTASLMDMKREKSASTAESGTVTAVPMAAALPCPRISGGCFSGPNMLVIFDSRVALGQQKHSAATPVVAPSAPGKAAKAPANGPTTVKKTPRTYEQLLEMRDSRFTKKKSKKPPVKLLGGTGGGVAGGAMEMGSEWSGMDRMDTRGYVGDDTGDHSVHGLRRGMRGSGFFSASGVEGGNEGQGDEFAVHGGSEYLKMYFSSAEFHLPVNHPDHRTSLPPSSSIQGLTLSPPRSAMTASSGLIRGLGAPLSAMVDSRSSGKRGVDPTAMPSFLSDLNMKVTVLDLSQLCGVSSVLTYGSQLTAAVRPRDGVEEVESRPKDTLDAGTQDLYKWMLKASQSRRVSSRITNGRRARRDTSLSSPVLTSQKSHPLSRILQSLLNSDAKTQHEHEQNPAAATSVSDVCAHNARIASLAGRSDLEQVWSLLELSTASNVQLPQQHQQIQHLKSAPVAPAPAGFDALVTSHPWKAHPFGQNLVNKMLGIYEESGDLPTLASIVCALQPPPQQEPDMSSESFRSDRPRQSQAESMTLYSAAHGGSSSLSLSSTMTSTAAAGSATTAATAGKPTSSPFSRSRTSFNSLTQLLGAQSDTADAAPAMRSARRSSSHNEVPKLNQAAGSPTTGYRAGAKDWPMAGRPGSTSGNARQQLSPVAGPIGWKGIDFDKMDNPFKTWSGGSTAARADVSPKLTQDTFRPPPPPLSAAAMPPRRRRESSIVDGDDDASLEGRILLQVNKRYGVYDHHLLSTSPVDELRYDGYKEAYAELLYRYGALSLRGDVLKSTATDTSSSSGDEADEDEGLTFGVLCRACQAVTDGPYCSSCRDFSVKCSICQLVVRGQSMYCMTCGHGGHEQHLREWFETENACPTGCGCWCKQATAMAAPVNSSHSRVLQPTVVEGRLQSRSYSF